MRKLFLQAIHPDSHGARAMIRAVAAACTAVLVAGSPADAATDRPSIRAEVTYGTKDQLRALLDSGVDVTHAHGARFDVLVTAEQLA